MTLPREAAESPTRSHADDSPEGDPERTRLEREVNHWRGLYEQLVVDARANITDAEGQIEMARSHIEELVGFIDGARELEQRLTLEVEHWRGLYENAIAEATRGSENANTQLDQARETILDLTRQLDDAVRERERLVDEIGYWSDRAERLRPPTRRHAWLARLGSALRRLAPDRLLPEPGPPEPAVPASVMRERARVSRRFLRGDGVEIGALHSPTPVARGVHVRYVDRLSRAEQRAALGELREYPFVEVDLIDDGETLDSIDDASLDFIIASHVLEHCENPLGTIRNHLRKLRVGGHLFYALPDKRFCFDSERPITPFSHLVEDDRDGPEASRRDHYLEYARLVDGFAPEEAEAAADRMLAERADIHFHVWDQPASEALWREAARYLEIPHTIEYAAFSQVENLAVLRRSG